MMGARRERPKVLYVELAPADSEALALLERRFSRRGVRCTRAGVVRALIRKAVKLRVERFEG